MRKRTFRPGFCTFIAFISFCVSILSGFTSSSSDSKTSGSAPRDAYIQLNKTSFGTTADGQEATLYTLTADSSLRIGYTATTYQATPVDLTNHSYFNLSASKSEDIYGHEVQLYADEYKPVDRQMIPTGELASVAGTSFDVTEPTILGEFIHQLPGDGYNHNYVLRVGKQYTALAAMVYEPESESESGRELQVYDIPKGLQHHTGISLHGSQTGKNDEKHTRLYAPCLETKHYPDSPNQEAFPSSSMQPRETYSEMTLFDFSVRSGEKHGLRQSGS